MTPHIALRFETAHRGAPCTSTRRTPADHDIRTKAASPRSTGRATRRRRGDRWPVHRGRHERDVMRLPAPTPASSTCRGRRVIPGLNDSHTHLIRGGLNYNLELRWDGVRSLADAMAMLREQVAAHAGAAVGARGRRLHRAPVRREAAADAGRDQRRRARHAGVHPAPVRPRAAQRAPRCAPSATRATRPTRPAARSSATARGNPTGLLLAKPNALILYATLAKGPKLPPEYQVNSTRHFMRELNRLGITSRDRRRRRLPELSRRLRGHRRSCTRDGELTVRIAYNLFTQKPRQELADFERWTEHARRRAQGDDLLPPQRRRRDAGVLGRRLRGLPRAAPGSAARRWKRELDEVVRLLAREALAVPHPCHLRRIASRACSTSSRR